eukprot:418727-Ditylum_brightwellii.AAC.1
MLDTAKYNIQLPTYKPEIEINNEKVAMEALAIYTLKSYARMAQELMKWVASMPSAYLNVVKFVPASLVTAIGIKCNTK